MQALVDSELQPSRGQARKTIASNAVTINGENSPTRNMYLMTAIVCLVATPYCVAVRKITVWSAGSNCVKAGAWKPRPLFCCQVHKMKNILAIQSHVVFGHAGNSAAEFPMRRLGANVWPLNTVQFSNHTQYGKWTGCVMPPAHLTEIVQGLLILISCSVVMRY